jgi:tetratricopeptide (TPR) repeat protein
LKRKFAKHWLSLFHKFVYSGAECHDDKLGFVICSNMHILKNLRSLFFLLLCLSFLFSCKPKSREEKYSLSDSTKNSAEQLTELIKQNPNQAELFYYRSKLYLNTGNNNGALSDMLAAVAIDSSRSEYFLQLGDIYFSKLFVARAISSFEKCVSLDSKNIFAELKLAELFLYLKKYADCIQHADKALLIDKTNAKAYYIKGYMFKETGDTMGAISSFQTAVEQKPEYFDACMQLGYLFTMKKNALALQYYEKARQLRRNNPDVLYGIAMFMQENDFVDSAEVLYQAILESTPDYKEAIFNLGYINLIYNNNFERALEYFSAVHRLDTNDVRAIYNRGLCFEKLRKKENAESDYRKALQLDPKYVLAQEGLKRIGKNTK